MANLIDILINAKWTGSQAVTQASGDLRKMGNSATATSSEIAAANQKTGFSFGALSSTIFGVTAAITAVIVTAKKLGQAIVEGAEIDNTIIRFDRLADSIGTTGEVLRRDLTVATRGLVSDLQAMASATDFLALGLARDSNEAIRLTNVASQLGFDMNQLVLTLTNMTTLRFDALGVRVDGFNDKVKALEATGLSASDAFREAFLRQAEEQLEIVGSRAETTAGQIDILTASWENFQNRIKLQTLAAASPIIANWTEGLDEASKLTGDLSQALKDLEGAGTDFGEQQRAISDFRMALAELFDLTGIATGFDDEVAALAGSLARSGETIEEQQRILEDYGFTITDTITGQIVILDDYAVAWDKVAQAIEGVQFADIDQQIGAVDEKLANFIKRNQELNAVYEGQQIPLDELVEFADEMGVTAEQAKELAIQLGGTGKALEYLKNFDSEGFFSGFRESFADFGEGLVSIFETAQERAQKFLDFQDDLTDISSREGELRAEAEETYEQRRTELAAQFGLRRVQDEQDFNRQRARQDAQLQASIDKTRADSADREIDLKERANKRLVELEQDHLDRMTDIVKSADLQLIQAAGKLDAASLVSIQQQRDAALKSEEKSYADSRENIKEQLAEQIEAEREAARERIAALEAANAERQRIEDEDRAIRLQREKDAFDLRVAEYDRQEQERLDQIKEQGRLEREARGDEYEDFWTSREGIESGKMADILKAEAAWWDDRLGLVPSGNGAQGFNPLGAMFPVQGGGTNVGGITVNVAGGGSPAETGDAVRDALIQLFGGFQ